MKTLLLFGAIALSINAYAQTKATTEDGKEVVLNEDGTWKYSEEGATSDVTSSELDDKYLGCYSTYGGHGMIEDVCCLFIDESSGEMKVYRITYDECNYIWGATMKYSKLTMKKV